MIRMHLRQFRSHGAVALASLVAVAVVVWLSHRHLSALYDTTVASCGARSDCDTARIVFQQAEQTLRTWLGVLTVAAPAVIGVFWGAPLVAREYESGTFRWAWTQSVTRERWLLGKVAVAALATVATIGGISLLVTWWAALGDQVGEQAFDAFDQRDLAPVGHALLALAIGVTAGLLLRRVLPAMVATLVVFAGTRAAVVNWVRPHLGARVLLDQPLDPRSTGYGSTDRGALSLLPGRPDLPNAWFHSVEIVDSQGRLLAADTVTSACPSLAGGTGAVGPGPHPSKVDDRLVDALRQCVDEVSRTHHLLVDHHPAASYWSVQWLEFGICVAAAVLLLGACAFMLRRRSR